MLLEGKAFLAALLRGHYGANDPNPLQHAVLDSTYFVHPSVVAQTEGLPIVRARRFTIGEKKNTIVDGVFVSDNFPPDYVFRAATRDQRDQGSTQLSHIYGGNGEARDAFFYTNLANLCLMPSFLAKLADTDRSVVSLLKRCAYDLYGFDPTGVFAGTARDEGVTEQVKLAAPPSERLFDELMKKKNAAFLTARKAGFLYATSGKTNAADPWVAEMIRRRATPSPIIQEERRGPC